MTTVVAAMLDIAKFNAEIGILSSAIAAKENLGLDAQAERQKRATLRYDGATVVAAMRIVGWTLETMSDDGSVEGYFDRPMSVTVEILPQSLSSAKASIQMQRLVDAWYECDGLKAGDAGLSEEELGSGFSSVQLLDNLGNIVAEASAFYAGMEILWQPVRSLGETEAAELLGQVHEFEAEAAEEARWDNFDSARTLRDRANAIRRQIAMSQNCRRVVH